MATTTASKQGLRAAATKRTAKAAQRTPLPPKAENVRLAREAVAESAKAKPTKRTATAARAKQAKDALKPTKATEATVTNIKASKAERHVPHYEAHGWDVKITKTGDKEDFLAVRGSEVIHQVWVNGVWKPEEGGTWTIGDKTIKVRNAAEAHRWAERSPEEAAKEYTKTTTSKYRKAPVKTAVAPEKMPFALDAPEDEIVAALAGKTLHWTNIYRDEEEVASVPKSSRFSKIVDAPDGSRVFMFCSPDSGFRALRLSALTRISGRTVSARAAA